MKTSKRRQYGISTEDQKVKEAILLAIVNDDQLTRSRLIDVLKDNLQGDQLSQSHLFNLQLFS